MFYGVNEKVSCFTFDSFDLLITNNYNPPKQIILVSERSEREQIGLIMEGVFCFVF